MGGNVILKANPFLWIREQVESSSNNPQDLNRRWWERMPMTYVDWGMNKRDLSEHKAFHEVQKAFLQNNPWVIENIDFAKFRNKRVLEIGCGSGAAACLFANAGASVTAIDITETSVRLANACAEACGVHMSVHQMDAEQTSFSSDSFDYIFSWGVLHHTSHPLRAFKEVSRLLKPGGEGLIMVYNRSSLRYYLKGLYWLLLKRKIFKGYSLSKVQRFFTDGYYHNHFTAKELALCLSDVGLTTHRISITHISKRMIPFITKRLDEYLKTKYGWLLIAEFHKH